MMNGNDNAQFEANATKKKEEETQQLWHKDYVTCPIGMQGGIGQDTHYRYAFQRLPRTPNLQLTV